tara:strand:- start:2596 stop:2925 length:330 start_codon:yes stop_codon:yes gene_type:complete
MGWFNWFRRTKPIVAEAEDKSPFEQAKEILSQSNKKEDIISEKMEEATVELEKFEEADIVKEVPKRARTKKGTYKSDDKSTPDINEAWEGGKAPKPKKKTVKVIRKKKK